jgi:Zn-dependent protease with chaperone function
MEQRALQLTALVTEEAKKAGIDNLEVRISDKVEVAAVTTTREGNHYFILNPAILVQIALDKEKTGQFLGLIGHELAHIKNGDTLPAGIIESRDPVKRRLHETLADLKGTATG